MRINKKGVVTVLVLGGVAAWLTAEERTNPPVAVQLDWKDPEVEALFRRACIDCHSHETRWPWYSRLAPVYWYLNDHVTEGREHFNISVEDWGDADEAPYEIREGNMPPSEYLFLHSEARLDQNEKEKLADGLAELFGVVDQEERWERRKERKELEAEEHAGQAAGDGDDDDADDDGIPGSR